MRQDRRIERTFLRRALLSCIPLLALAPVEAAGSAGTNALIVLPHDAGSRREIREDLRAAGVQIRHRISERLILAHATAEAAVPLRKLGARMWTEGTLPAAFMENPTGVERAALMLWDQAFAAGGASRGFAAGRAPTARAGDGGGLRSIRDRLEFPPETEAVLREGIEAADLPYGADANTTSEYLIGDVAIAIVFVSSDGTNDPDTEIWTEPEMDHVLSEIIAAGEWLITASPFDLSFTYDNRGAVRCGYEPISHATSDFGLWLPGVMGGLGYTGENVLLRARAFANDVRAAKGTDWSVVTFQVDASHDPDGVFTDGYGGFAFYGGPISVVAYDDSPAAIPHRLLFAHELTHNFYSLDEYPEAGRACDQRSGYLYWDNQNSAYHPSGACESNVDCVMRGGCPPSVCGWTAAQMGWHDEDSDGIADILDLEPETMLNGAPADYPPVFTGMAAIRPLPCRNPMFPDRAISVDEIDRVEYRVNDGPWKVASPSDGTWDEPEELFDFAVSDLVPGRHRIEARAVSRAGSVDATGAQLSFDLDPEVWSPGGPGDEKPRVWLTPNPARTEVQVGYVFPRAIPEARCDFHDAAGRLIRTIEDHSNRVRSGSILWNLRDDFGREVPAGIYLLRVRAGPDHTSSRIVVVR
jgi:hypothetical protein